MVAPEPSGSPSLSRRVFSSSAWMKNWLRYSGVASRHKRATSIDTSFWWIFGGSRLFCRTKDRNRMNAFAGLFLRKVDLVRDEVASEQDGF